jgi:hypothetical protein
MLFSTGTQHRDSRFRFGRRILVRSLWLVRSFSGGSGLGHLWVDDGLRLGPACWAPLGLRLLGSGCGLGRAACALCLPGRATLWTEEAPFGYRDRVIHSLWTERTLTALIGTLDGMDGGRIRRHRGATLLTIGVLSTAGLIACTGDDAPPPPSSTATPSIDGSTTAPPSPTATPPTAPPARPTPKSAEAFVKYFWQVYNYSYASLDPQILESISEKQCQFCHSTITDVKQLRTSGTRIEGLTVHLISAAGPPVEDPTRIAVITAIRQDRGRSIKRDGSIQELSGRTATQSVIALHWIRNAWQVRGVSIDTKKQTP